MLHSKGTNILEEFKNRLLERLQDNVIMLRLFGSKARGDYHNASDIDLLLVLRKKNREIEEAIIDIELEVMDRYGYQPYISTICFDDREFRRLNTLKTNFMLNVAEDGVTLWESSGT